MDEEFKKITDTLVQHLSFPESEKRRNGNGQMKKWNIKKGECISWPLYDTSEHIGVDKWYNSAGSIFDAHEHKEQEWIFVGRGEMRIIKADKECIVKAGEHIVNEPHEKHYGFFPVDTVYITIMIPPSKDYKDG